jgi:hypothetical protein
VLEDVRIRAKRIQENKAIVGIEANFIIQVARAALKSVLVEVNNNYAHIDAVMKRYSFTDWNQFNGADINRRAGKPQRNVIYTREA